MKYRSTRSNETVTAEEALVKGLADDGGLYVPEFLPAPFLHADELKDMTYEELAAFVLSHFLTDIPEEELKKLTHSVYTGTFETKDIVPVKPLSQAFSMAEMFHGRTCAFKDLALSLFPYLLVYAKKEEKDDQEILILTATSGDTGKAALEGFRDVPGVHIMVFYPSHGVSPLQKDQMQKQLGSNVKVVGIEGNFDDAQGTLKQVFGSSLRKEEAEKGVLFSSANSINIGRLLPQVVYYVWIWLKLLKNGSIGEHESFNVVVPTGNFGNILAAWLAKQVGAPIGRLICASNENKVLADFFETGVYDINRPFYMTEAPSMDILISSNFERFLYYLTGSAEQVRESMDRLKKEGKYEVSKEAFAEADMEMMGGWASPEDMAHAMSEVYENYDYLMDPHTAVAYAVYDHLRREGEIPRHSHTVIISTAHPYKFPGVVAKALGLKEMESPYDTLREIADKTGIPVPKQLGELENRPKRFTETVDRKDMADTIRSYADEICGSRH